MSEKKYFWLKLHDDFFSSKRIKKLRKLGSDFVIIYLKMQLLSLKNGGVIEYTGIEEDMADEIALDIDEDTDKVQLTISYLQSCGLLEVNDKNEYFLPYVEKCTGSETQWAEKKRMQRQKKDNVLEIMDNVPQLSIESPKAIGQCPTEIDKDIELEKDIRVRVRKEEREVEEKDPPTIRLSYSDEPVASYRSYGETENVLLKNDDFKALATEFGLPTLLEYINRLSDYMFKNNKTYRDHASVIRGWITKDKGIIA